MNRMTKKVFAIILMVLFIILNVCHVIFPVWLIVEDIKAGTMHGTGMELGVLYPWLMEILSVPVVLAQVIYYIVFSRVKYFHLANFIVFLVYLLQVLLFNVLLWV